MTRTTTKGNEINTHNFQRNFVFNTIEKDLIKSSKAKVNKPKPGRNKIIKSLSSLSIKDHSFLKIINNADRISTIKYIQNKFVN